MSSLARSDHQTQNVGHADAWQSQVDFWNDTTADENVAAAPHTVMIKASTNEPVAPLEKLHALDLLDLQAQAAVTAGLLSVNTTAAIEKAVAAGGLTEQDKMMLLAAYGAGTLGTIAAAERGTDGLVSAAKSAPQVLAAKGIDSSAVPLPVITDPYEDAVQLKLKTLEIDAEARRRFNETQNPTPELPPVRSLTALLAEPDTDDPYLIEDLATQGSRVMLLAQYKSGKSTLLHGNLIPALVDGTPFLGRFTVNQTVTGLVLIDDELDEDMLRRWLRRSGIKNTDAVADVISLRGKTGTLNLLDDKTRSRWARRLRDVNADYLMLDCLRPVLDALGLDENHDGGRFLTAFDALCDEAGIRNALVVQHMGHTGERARGDSRFMDWPDQTWRMIREDTDDPASQRYFKAFGRLCEVAEGALTFDKATGRYTYDEGGRKEAAAAVRAGEALHHIIAALVDDHLADGAGMKRQDLVDLLSLHHRIGRNKTDDAIAKGVADGSVALDVGQRGAKVYRLANPCQRCGNPVAETDRNTHRECE
ncbi:AAA family ATPase [Mycobacterium sp. URHB0021]